MTNETKYAAEEVLKERLRLQKLPYPSIVRATDMLRFCADLLRQQSAQPPKCVPDGYVLVPIEPTHAMCSAPDTVWHPEARNIWQQMIAAAKESTK